MRFVKTESNEPIRPAFLHDGWTGEAMAGLFGTRAETGVGPEAWDAARKSSACAWAGLAATARSPKDALHAERAVGETRDRINFVNFPFGKILPDPAAARPSDCCRLAAST
jgi:hypothetical protein